MPIMAAGVLVTALLLVVLIGLDLARKLSILNPVVLALGLSVIVNAPLVVFLVTRSLDPAWRWPLVVLGLTLLYVWIRLNVFGVCDGVPVGFRLKALGGATPLLYSAVFMIIVELAVLPLSFALRPGHPLTGLLVVNTTWAVACCLLLHLNGAIRAAAGSRSLSIVSRMLVLTCLWIPVFGWLIGVGAARAVRREYLAAVDRVEWEQALPRDDRCATRYPIVLVHGIGWRDYEFFNAWGRIPKYLKRHGATVFHGGQQAWGTIEENAAHIADRISDVLEGTGAPKVNIIAHSRGGIDARCAISTLGMGDRVASLTTMNTPHHGVRFADTATNLKEPVYLRLAAVVNFLFRLAGDQTPDFRSSTMALRTERSKEFNRDTPDDPTVFYQSYTSVMSRASSHRLLAVPYRVIKVLGEENDGLVSVDSARWGEFRGVLRSTSKRGVSHGDLVDMNREDFAGFNVLDAYITLVADLRERGY